VKIVRKDTKEKAQYSYNPHPDIPRGKCLPPNAGMKKAIETSKASIESSELTDAIRSSSKASSSAHKQLAVSQDPYMPRDIFSLYTCRPGQTDLTSFGQTLTKTPPPGSIGFEQSKYADFVALKASGTLGAWELTKSTVTL
jgi:hypothetical protein